MTAPELQKRHNLSSYQYRNLDKIVIRSRCLSPWCRRDMDASLISNNQVIDTFIGFRSFKRSFESINQTSASLQSTRSIELINHHRIIVDFFQAFNRIDQSIKSIDALKLINQANWIDQSDWSSALTTWHQIIDQSHRWFDCLFEPP